VNRYYLLLITIIAVVGLRVFMQLTKAPPEGTHRQLPESVWETMRTGPICYQNSPQLLNGTRAWHPTDGVCRLKDAPAWGGQFAIDFLVPQESIGGDDRVYILVPAGGFVEEAK
jgi:hypothetical protein